jgi:hypothetical protein
VQSVPCAQSAYSAPGPPSSQRPSEAYPKHVSVQSCALVMATKPNATRRKTTRSSRGADPKRHMEPRRAEGRLDAKVALTAPAPLGGDPEIEASAQVGRAAKTWTRQTRASIAIVNGRGVVSAPTRGEVSSAGTSHASIAESRSMASVPRKVDSGVDEPVDGHAASEAHSSFTVDRRRVRRGAQPRAEAGGARLPWRNSTSKSLQLQVPYCMFPHSGGLPRRHGEAPRAL